jgi:type VI secretion system protein ImpH
MATTNGRKRAGVIGRLFEASYRFNFFQAVRLLEQLMRKDQRDNSPDHPQIEASGVGRDLHPRSEAVRFRALPSLSFPAGAISDLRSVPGSDRFAQTVPPPEMLVTFLGLTGPSGALPRHYTELLLQRIREKDSSLRDFLDLFNHRLISLFYRAWEKYNWPILYERAWAEGAAGEPDPITQAVYCLDGLGTAGLRRRLDVDDEVFLYFCGHFAHAPRSAMALQCLLSEYMQMPVEVIQCQGQWLTLEPEDRAFLPSASEPKGRNTQPSVNFVIGERVWDVQSKFRLRLGPLDWPQFRSLMPNGPALRPLCQITRLYAGAALDFDVQPTLKPEEVPAFRLTTDPDERPYLGWCTWTPLAPAGAARIIDDAVFQSDPI